MFKMLSFGLDAGFESFPPLVNGLVHNRLFQVSPDLNKSLLQFSQITAAGTRPMPNFSSTMNPQLNGSALCEKIILGELILINLCRLVLGVRFL